MKICHSGDNVTADSIAVGKRNRKGRPKSVRDKLHDKKGKAISCARLPNALYNVFVLKFSMESHLILIRCGS